MVSLKSIALAAALSFAAAIPAVGETVLLDFSASWCGPCRSMQPVVEQLAKEGYPVRQVDFDRNRELANRYQVSSIPCFVMIVNDKEVDRVVGTTSRDNLVQMIQRAGGQAAKQSPAQPTDQSLAGVRAQSPDVQALSPIGAGTQPETTPSASVPAPTSPSYAAKSTRSTVRIKVDDKAGHSYATGTIIDSRQGEALVLTCGHIFRESQGKGPITVDLFSGEQPVAIAGQLISYDEDRDLGLVAIRPTTTVEVSPVAPRGYKLGRGQRVVSLGCNNGQQPTANSTHVVDIDRYAEPSNIEAAGMPVEGRSGGGLFDEQGRLVGVCYAADAAADEGVYAGLDSIHAELDRLGLQDVYQSASDHAALAATAVQTSPPDMPSQMPPANRVVPAAATSDASDVGPSDAADMSSGSATMSDARSLSRREQAALAEINRRRGNAEVICIVRPTDPNAKSEVIVLEQVSQQFVRQLTSAEHRAAGPERLTSLHVPRVPNAPLKR